MAMLMFRFESRKKLEKYKVKFSSCEEIAEVINDTLKYYVCRARRNQYMFFIFSVLLLLINFAVLVVNQIPFDSNNVACIKLTITILSGIATLMASISALFRFTDNWSRFRKRAEDLKIQCLLFNHGNCEDYKGKTPEEKESIFIQKFIKICEDDKAEFIELMNKLDELNKNKDDNDKTDIEDK
jgi:hypothetical protein